MPEKPPRCGALYKKQLLYQRAHTGIKQEVILGKMEQRQPLGKSVHTATESHMQLSFCMLQT